MQDAAFVVGLIAAAATFALLEIHVEGRAGWAARLPTWRWRSVWWNWLFPGRPLTGYHFWSLAFVAVVAHLPFAFGLPWSWRGELRSFAFVSLFWVLEDFLWFVLNPHFGLRRFRREHIAWHRETWWWVAPRDYWIGATAGVVLYLASRPQSEPLLIALLGH